MITPVISDSRLPSANGLKLDLSGFKDEVDVLPTAEFIKRTGKLSQITFGELNDSQVTELAQNVASVLKTKGPDFIKFTNPGVAGKFAEALKPISSTSTTTSSVSKPLPAVPPSMGKTSVVQMGTPTRHVYAGTNGVPPVLPPIGKSPPKVGGAGGGDI